MSNQSYYSEQSAYSQEDYSSYSNNQPRTVYSKDSYSSQYSATQSQGYDETIAPTQQTQQQFLEQIHEDSREQLDSGVYTTKVSRESQPSMSSSQSHQPLEQVQTPA